MQDDVWGPNDPWETSKQISFVINVNKFYEGILHGEVKCGDISLFERTVPIRDYQYASEFVSELETRLGELLQQAFFGGGADNG